MFDWDDWGYGSAFALLLWLPFGLWRFTRVRPAIAAAEAMLWAMMWLPEGAAFDLPLLPPASKYTIGAVCALLGVWWKAPARLRAARIGRGYDLIIALMMVAQIGSVLNNQDVLHYGTWRTIDLPIYTAYDGFSTAVRLVLTIGLPCWLGRALLRSEQDLRDVLRVLVVAGLVYSLPILFEVRMSPMLHEYVYGYAPRTDWSQNLRAGGYRPTVFMGHGLVVGFFMFLCTMAAVTLHKAGKKRLFGVPMAAVVAYLVVILILCKAAAPMIYAAIGFIGVRYCSARQLTRLLAVLAFVVVSYPIVRILDVFPEKQLLSLASTLGPERVQSLKFRFDNEDMLLVKGAERLWFGYGGFSRERVYDAESAKDLVIQDGHWVLVFGTSGLIGFLCYFAFFVVPVWRVGAGLRQLTNPADRALLSGLGVLVVTCAVNMLPNMPLPYLQFYFAAGLSVLVAGLPKRAGQAVAAASARKARELRSLKPKPLRMPPLRPVWYGEAPPWAYRNIITLTDDIPTPQPVAAEVADVTPAGAASPARHALPAIASEPDVVQPVAAKKSAAPKPTTPAVSKRVAPKISVPPPPPAAAGTSLPPLPPRPRSIPVPPPASVRPARAPKISVPPPAAGVSRPPHPAVVSAPRSTPAAAVSVPPPRVAARSVAPPPPAAKSGSASVAPKAAPASPSVAPKPSVPPVIAPLLSQAPRISIPVTASKPPPPPPPPPVTPSSPPAPSASIPPTPGIGPLMPRLRLPSTPPRAAGSPSVAPAAAKPSTMPAPPALDRSPANGNAADAAQASRGNKKESA